MALQTKFGEVEYNWTEANHVYIGTVAERAIVVNGIQCQFSVHLNRLEDGSWGLLERHNLYTSDRWNGKKHIPVSDSVRTKVLAEMTDVWTKHAAANPAESKEAERTHLEELIARQNETVAQATKELRDCEQILYSLRSQLAAL